MGTPCAIGMKMADGSVKAIRCNYDGYVAGAGAILGLWYTQPEQVEALLKLGDLSELGEEIDDCVAYHRDRGEELSPAVKFVSVEDFRRTGKAKMCADFLYIFEDGQWNTYGLRNTNEWVKLNVITGQCENSKGGPPASKGGTNTLLPSNHNTSYHTGCFHTYEEDWSYSVKVV